MKKPFLRLEEGSRRLVFDIKTQAAQFHVMSGLHFSQ
jgi:hypothetical protein